MGSPALGPRGGNLEAPNGSEYRRSRLNTTIDEATGLPTLHRFQDSSVPGHQNEKPWHRMAAMLMVAGVSNKKIAEAAQVSEVAVSQLKAQRWFQELLSTLTNEATGGVMGMLQSEAMSSVAKLVELRDGAESERVQLQAATTLLEHANGKAVTKVISHNTNQNHYSSESEEYEAIKRELETLKELRLI